MKTTHVTYHCDKCKKRLLTCNNDMVIVTELNESNIGWSRLKVKIEHHHGSHNDGQHEDAELCQECAIALLDDALQKVRSGIRATTGSQSIYEERWK